MSNAWYVAATHGGQEAKARKHLLRQGFEPYLPTAETTKGRRPLFRGYIFVLFDISRQRWRSIYGTFGVKTLIGMGDMPSPIDSEIVREIKAREIGEDLVPLCPYEKGERVTLNGGPWYQQNKIDAIFQTMDEQEQCRLLIDMLGRPVEVTASLSMIEA